MRGLAKLEDIVRHYFDPSTSMFDDNNSLAFIGLVLLAISLVFAFFTMGITNENGVPFLSYIFVGGGFAVFVLGYVFHSLMFILGSFYKNGIIYTIGSAVFGSVAIIGYLLYVLLTVVILPFIAVGLISATPSFGVFAPIKVLLLIGTSLYGVSKGFSLSIHLEHPYTVFSKEISLVKSVYSSLRTSPFN